MRHRYFVGYDISDDKRWRRVFRVMNGYGDAVQYSLFLCDLSAVEKERLKLDLTDVIHHGEDRILIVQLGPAAGDRTASFECLGRQLPAPAERSAVIV